MSQPGRIVAGMLAPHPPHLVYAENPPQNEPRAECGWETLRWGYERARQDLEQADFDVIVVLTAHWQTYVGTHLLGVEHFKSLSVDPIFPNLFRYHYDLSVDVPLAEAIAQVGTERGLQTKLMRNPDFRVDYGTIVSCHMVRPEWDIPIVAISSNRSAAYYNVDVMQEQAKALGAATREAVERSGRRALLLASNSLSHRHFTTESSVPEDMSKEHIYNHHQYLWDMRIIELMRAGRSREIIDMMPEFVEQAVSEADAGGLTWLMSALDYPKDPAEIYAYGTVIGTGNVVAGWRPVASKEGQEMTSPFSIGALVPGLPHPLLAPELNPGWQRLREGFDEAAALIAASEPDLLLVYSTMWPSVIGHQIQAHPTPTWVHVDELFHDLGSIPYSFNIDTDYSRAFCEAAQRRGLSAREVAYHGFPIDTGSVVALKLLNPDNRFPACIVSSNMYSDRAETIVLGKAARDAATSQGKRVAAICVMTLSNRLFTTFIDPKDDAIHSPKDEEWNQKLLEFLRAGRLEDVAQLSREIQRQIRVKKVVNFKPMWWLSAAMGGSNAYDGSVHAYEALYGTGGAVVTLTPSANSMGLKEFDEDEVEVFVGERGILNSSQPDPGTMPGSRGTESPSVASVVASTSPETPANTVKTSAAPKPVGAYPHAKRVGDFLFVSGMGPRQPEDNSIPGGPVRTEDGSPRNYDVEAQTKATIENIRVVLEASGLTLNDIVDVTSFLIDMDRDFAGYNKVYAEYFTSIQATRTTLAITALPTPIAVEMKVIARFSSEP